MHVTLSSYPKIAMIVLNWNGKNDTCECLESLRQLNYPNYEIIVVDNGSTDGSQKFLRENFPEVILIENERNFGFGGGFNVGIKKALKRKAEYIVCLNNDVIVDKNFLIELVKVGELSPEIGGLYPMAYYYDQPNRINGAGGVNRFINGKVFGCGELDNGQYNKVRENMLLCGPAIVLKEKTLLDVGFFDVSYFYGPEDLDIALRAIRAGYKLIFVPNAKLWHKTRGATGGRVTPLTSYFSIRNRILFVKKHANALEFALFISYFLLLYFPFTLFRWFLLGKRRHTDAALKGVLWHINKRILPADEEMVKIFSE